MTPRSAADEARDPGTSPDRLLDIAHRHPQLHGIVVLNPSCPAVAREWILATNSWARTAYEQAQEQETASQEKPQDEAGTDTAEEKHEEGEEDEEIDEASVWGDLAGLLPEESPTEENVSAPPPVASPRPASAPAPAPAPAGTSTASGQTVRIAPTSAVVPLGPGADADGAAPPSSTMPIAPVPSAVPAGSAEPRVDPFTAAGPAAEPIPPAASGAQQQAVGAPVPIHVPAPEGEKRVRPWPWLIGGGCLVLALLLVIAAVIAGQAWLSADSGEYEREPTTSSSPSAPPTEAEKEPEEETPRPDPVSPAPDGAREIGAIASPTGNISCTLEEDRVGCSVAERDFSEGVEDCPDGPFSIQVADSEATTACGQAFGGGGTTLEYDSSAVKGDMACTSRFDGMTCWNTMTGRGFMVNRVTVETF